jgi:hypothetical protein
MNNPFAPNLDTRRRASALNGMGMGGAQQNPFAPTTQGVATMGAPAAPAAPSATPSAALGTGVSQAGGGGGFYRPQNNNQLANAQAKNSFRQGRYAWRQLRPALNDLHQQGQQDQLSPEMRSAFLAPYIDATDDAYSAGQGNVARNLFASGMGDSTTAASAYAQLEDGNASARSRAVGNLYQSEDERQRSAQAAERAILLSLLSGGNDAAQIAGQQQQIDLARDQFNRQQQFGYDEIMSGLGLAAGFAFPGAGGAGAAAGMAGAAGAPRKSPYAVNPYY